MDGGVYSIALGTNSTFIDNVLWVNTKNGVKNGVSYINENILVDNTVKSDFETVDATSGTLFYGTGSGKSIQNKVLARAFKKYNSLITDGLFVSRKNDYIAKII